MQAGVKDELDLSDHHRLRPTQLKDRRKSRGRIAHPAMKTRTSPVRRRRGIKRARLSRGEFGQDVIPKVGTDLVSSLIVRVRKRCRGSVDRARLGGEHLGRLAARLRTGSRDRREGSEVIDIVARYAKKIGVVTEEALLNLPDKRGVSGDVRRLDPSAQRQCGRCADPLTNDRAGRHYAGGGEGDIRGGKISPREKEVPHGRGHAGSQRNLM